VKPETVHVRNGRSVRSCRGLRADREGVHDEDADGTGDAGQLWRAVDLGVVHVEPRGDAVGRDGLAQAVQEGVESLVGIELGVRNEASGVVQRGLEEDLLLARPTGRTTCRTARSDWQTALRTFYAR
jgi:hypothetical protein